MYSFLKADLWKRKLWQLVILKQLINVRIKKISHVFIVNFIT